MISYGPRRAPLASVIGVTRSCSRGVYVSRPRPDEPINPHDGEGARDADDVHRKAALIRPSARQEIAAFADNFGVPGSVSQIDFSAPSPSAKKLRNGFRAEAANSSTPAAIGRLFRRV